MKWSSINGGTEALGLLLIKIHNRLVLCSTDGALLYKLRNIFLFYTGFQRPAKKWN